MRKDNYNTKNEKDFHSININKQAIVFGATIVFFLVKIGGKFHQREKSIQIRNLTKKTNQKKETDTREDKDS